MQINSSVSSTSSIFNMDEMDSKLSASIISAKDTDDSGTVSASELGVSDSDVAQFDTDGDGVLSSEELAAALKAKREKMQAQMSTEMQQNSQLGMLQSTLSTDSSESTDSSQEASGQPSLDNLIAGLFSDGESSSSSVSAASASSSSSSNAGDSLTEYLEQMDSQMAETIMSLKDTDGDGTLSAEEMGATAEQIAKLDTDGDGVLSESELTSGLKAERESMMADFWARQKASNAYQSVDNLIAGLFDSGAASQSVSLEA